MRIMEERGRRRKRFVFNSRRKERGRRRRREIEGDPFCRAGLEA